MKIKKKSNILVVEDDEFYGRTLDYQLRSHGFLSCVCGSARSLFDVIKRDGVPDLFILDFFLGGDEPSGLELCRKIVGYFQRPVVMLTANNDVDTIISCLNAGAEQYIVKPCDIRELVARVNVTLRKNAVTTLDSRQPLFLRLDADISLSWEKGCLVHTNGKEVALTQKEIGLLELFLKEHNRFIDRRKTFHALYGYEMDPMNRSIDVLVSKLRKKLKSLDDDYQITTLRGHGYKIGRAHV